MCLEETGEEVGPGVGLQRRWSPVGGAMEEMELGCVLGTRWSLGTGDSGGRWSLWGFWGGDGAGGGGKEEMEPGVLGGEMEPGVLGRRWSLVGVLRTSRPA